MCSWRIFVAVQRPNAEELKNPKLIPNNFLYIANFPLFIFFVHDPFFHPFLPRQTTPQRVQKQFQNLRWRKPIENNVNDPMRLAENVRVRRLHAHNKRIEFDKYFWNIATNILRQRVSSVLGVHHSDIFNRSSVVRRQKNTRAPDMRQSKSRQQ